VTDFVMPISSLSTVPPPRMKAKEQLLRFPSLHQSPSLNSFSFVKTRSFASLAFFFSYVRSLRLATVYSQRRKGTFLNLRKNFLTCAKN
jgi:hypothetical protein